MLRAATGHLKAMAVGLFSGRWNGRRWSTAMGKSARPAVRPTSGERGPRLQPAISKAKAYYKPPHREMPNAPTAWRCRQRALQRSRTGTLPYGVVAEPQSRFFRLPLPAE